MDNVQHIKNIATTLKNEVNVETIVAISQMQSELPKSEITKIVRKAVQSFKNNLVSAYDTSSLVESFSQFLILEKLNQEKKDFFKSLLESTDNLEVAINFYLVSMGGRDATLLEFANFENIDISNKLVDIAKELPNVKTGWESLGNQPRFLIANENVSDKLFTKALTSDAALGKILGFECIGGIGGSYKVETLASYDGKTVEIIAETCREQPRERSTARLDSVAFPGLTFSIVVTSQPFEYGHMTSFLRDNNISILYKNKDSLYNGLYNLSTTLEILKILSNINSEKQFAQFWRKYKNVVFTLSILYDNNLLEQFEPLNDTQITIIENTFKNIEKELLNL